MLRHALFKKKKTTISKFKKHVVITSFWLLKMPRAHVKQYYARPVLVGNKGLVADKGAVGNNSCHNTTLQLKEGNGLGIQGDYEISYVS